MEEINGHIIKVIYNQNNFLIAVLKTEDGPITITGPSFEFDEDSNYKFSGDYVNHPVYGFQFKFSSYLKIMPTKKDEVIKFFSSSLFKGIGKKTATKIYDSLGEECINILVKDRNYLNELNLSEKIKNSILEGLESLNDFGNQIRFELMSNGFNDNEAKKIYLKYKDDLPKVINDNPYNLYNDVKNIQYEHVINYSKNIDCEDKELKYNECLLIKLFNLITFETGDIYLNYEDFESIFYKYSNYDLNIVLEYSINNHHIINVNDRYYLASFYDDELFISEYLKNFNKNHDIDIDKINYEIESYLYSTGIDLSGKQKEAVINSFKNNFSIITGGPGTGKTTLIDALMKIHFSFGSYHNGIVVAPTGRASKRISELCGCEARTIHSLLRWDKDSEQFVFNEKNPITYDFIIIDEFSMVDNELFASFLKAAAYVKKIIIIGDYNQLPSIRQGDLLNDLINSNYFVCTTLNHNFRQSENNEIIDLAYKIINDDNDIDLRFYGKDIIYINSDNNLKVLENNLKNNIMKKYDIQCLSPMRKYNYGIDNINNLVQSIFNPKVKGIIEHKVGNNIFRENDRIIQLKNRVADDIFNGDIGYIQEIDLKDKSIYSLFDGTHAFHSFNELDELYLAYCVTIHKAQGSEYPIVHLILDKTHKHMLNKNLIYTAITRAKNKLYIYGDQELIKYALTKKLKKRKTTLIEYFNSI